MAYRNRSSFAEYAKKISAVLTLATATYNDVEIKLPVDVNAGAAAVIHRIDFYTDLDVQWVDSKYCAMQLTFSDQAAMLAPNNGDVLAFCKFVCNLTTSGGMIASNKETQNFKPPLLCVKDKIYFGAYEDSGSGMTVYVDIFYTIRAVSSKQAMQEILNQWGAL